MNLSRGFIVVSVHESFRDAPDCAAPLFQCNTVINIIIIMKTKTIQNVSTEGYKSPALNIMAFVSEGVLCISGEDAYGDFGKAGADGIYEPGEDY